jgi:HK97 family phage prohead protease
MQLRTKEYSVSIKSVDVAKREATFIASTSAIDSYDESIDQTSWRLERYRANPVVLFGHKSRELPIGTSVKVGLVGGNLEVVIRFATEKANPLAENVFQSVREGTLRAVSVGFVPNTIRSEMRDGKSIAVLADCELHEISVVPIPANPEALAKMRAKGIGHATPRNANDELLALCAEDADDLDTSEPSDLGELILRDVENFQRTSGGKAEPAWIANGNDELTALALDESQTLNANDL